MCFGLLCGCFFQLFKIAMQNYILFTAFNDAAINQCRFSLLKLLSLYNLKMPASIGIVVYTDKPQAFDVFTTFLPALYFLTLSNKSMDDDKTKADVINHFFENYTGNILYCSTATYAKQPLEDLFTLIENGTIIVNKRYAKPDKMQPKNIEQFSILGMSEQHKKMAPFILQGSDNLTINNVSVSYSYSRNLQNAGTINAAIAEDYFYDFYTLKEFDELLQIFFKKNEEESVPSLVKGLHGLNIDDIKKDKLKYEALPFYKKWMLVALGKAWSIKQYQQKW